MTPVRFGNNKFDKEYQNHLRFRNIGKSAFIASMDRRYKMKRAEMKGNLMRTGLRDARVKGLL